MRRGCPFYWGFGNGDAQNAGQEGKGKDLGKRLLSAREGRKEKTASPFPFPFHGPLRFVTIHSRFALASMRNRKSLRRRQVVDNYD